jgi:DNA-binding NtrC family response regulator
MPNDLDDKLLSTMPMATAARRAYREDIDEGRISLLIYHHESTHVISLEDGQQLVIGRDPYVEVAIDDQNLSRRHARFEVLGDEVWVEDLDSTNGTTLNGQEIRRVKMTVGDEVTMGGVTASIHVLLPTRRLGIDTHDHFLTALEDEVVRAHTFKRSLALVMLKAPTSLQKDKAQLAEEIREHLRPVDRLALYSQDTVEILLPEATVEQSTALAHELLASEALAGDRMLGFGIAVYPETGTSAEELLEVSRAAQRRASPEQPVQLAPIQGQSWEHQPPPSTGDQGPVVRSPAMRDIYATIERLANKVIPVLLIGETGTGKEVVARAIHEGGPRSKKRMACINCGAIPATLVESVLFGHERGAFTGASHHSKGIFEEADGGTVLLDEIGELSASAQAALLRVLETKQITRVGSNKEIPVDVRIIAATNRDLEAMCEQGHFREDLLYRINAMTLKIPPLCERPEEIAPLAELFIQQANEANGCNVQGIEIEAMRPLHQYPWPGNVRELRNAIERAVVITHSERITIEDLPQRVLDHARGLTAGAKRPSTEQEDEQGTQGSLDLDDGVDFKTRMQRLEAQVILEALRQADWNRAEAAQLLQMPVRTLSHKINQHGIKKLGYGIDDEPEE